MAGGEGEGIYNEMQELESLCIQLGGASLAEFHSHLRSAAMAARDTMLARSAAREDEDKGLTEAQIGGVACDTVARSDEDQVPDAQHDARDAPTSEPAAAAAAAHTPLDTAAPTEARTNLAESGDGAQHRVSGQSEHSHQSCKEGDDRLARLKPNAIVPKFVTPTWSVDVEHIRSQYAPENRWNVKKPFRRSVFHVGQHVLAKFNGSGEHYDGMVARINEDGKTYRVVFADGAQAPSSLHEIVVVFLYVCFGRPCTIPRPCDVSYLAGFRTGRPDGVQIQHRGGNKDNSRVRPAPACIAIRCMAIQWRPCRRWRQSAIVRWRARVSIVDWAVAESVAIRRERGFGGGGGCRGGACAHTSG